MTEIAKYRELVTELRESADEWLNEVRTRKQAADAIDLLLAELEAAARDRVRLRAALTELHAMYASTWDTTDGCLVMLGEGVARFEAAHEAAAAALAQREGDLN